MNLIVITILGASLFAFLGVMFMLFVISLELGLRKKNK